MELTQDSLLLMMFAQEAKVLTTYIELCRNDFLGWKPWHLATPRHKKAVPTAWIHGAHRQSFLNPISDTACPSSYNMCDILPEIDLTVLLSSLDVSQLVQAVGLSPTLAFALLYRAISWQNLGSWNLRGGASKAIPRPRSTPQGFFLVA